MEQIQYFFEILPIKDMVGVTIRETLDTRFQPPCTLLLDSSTHTGYVIYDSKKSIVCVGALNKGTQLTLTEYKFAMQERLKELIEQFQVKQVIYEDVFYDVNAHTSEVLLYIKHAIDDLNYLTGVEIHKVDNKKWKQVLARPNKFKGQPSEKEEIKQYVQAAYPLIFTGLYENAFTEDMIDVIGMGIALVVKVGRNLDLLKTVKYDKTLPIHKMVLFNTELSLKEQLLATRKKTFKEEYMENGLFILDSEKQTKAEDGLRQYLTHRDGVVAIQLTPSSKEWGLLILEHNIALEDLNEDKSFWLLAIKKKRK